MRLHFLLGLIGLIGVTCAQDDDDPEPEPEPEPQPTPTPGPLPVDTFANVTVYQPDNPSTQVTYARTENLPNNAVLSVWNDDAANNTISIYQSKDNGFSWYPFGSATSNVAGRKLLQPHLLYTNATFGEYEGGTVLLAVNAADSSSTNIEIYASGDGGETFEFVTKAASGGAPNTTSGATSVWEPFLTVQNNRLTVFYSDQKDAKYAQKISHRTATEDFESWGTPVDAVTSQVSTDRLGSPTFAKLPNRKYILTFSSGVLNNATNTYAYPVFYKIASSPEQFAKERIRSITVDTGAQLRGSPFVTWTPLGGPNGTIVVSSSNSNSVFINRALGEGIWKEVKTVAGRAYSREVRIPDNDSTKLRFAGGAEYGQTSPSQILVTVVDLEKALGRQG